MSGYRIGLRITYDDCLTAVNTLAVTHSLPNGNPPDRVAKVWVEALDGIEPGELKRAVKKFLREGGRFFPKPSEIRELALEYRAGVVGAIQPSGEPDYDAPCSVCGARLRLLSADEQGITETWDTKAGKMVPLDAASRQPPERYGYYHDAALHRKKREPWSGYPVPSPEGVG